MATMWPLRFWSSVLSVGVSDPSTTPSKEALEPSSKITNLSQAGLLAVLDVRTLDLGIGIPRNDVLTQWGLLEIQFP